MRRSHADLQPSSRHDRTRIEPCMLLSLVTSDTNICHRRPQWNMDTLSAIYPGSLMSPLQTTYETVAYLLAAETEQERDELTKQWRDHKLEELNFVGVVGALLAGCLTSTGSWPTILPNGKSSPWTVQTCWYTGIVFALFAVLTAAQQSVRLHRLSAHKHGLKSIRDVMTSRQRSAAGSIELRPRRLQIIGWQASIIFLTMSVLTMIAGMTIKIWYSTGYGPFKLESPDHGWWDDNVKVRLAACVTELPATRSLTRRRWL